MNVSAWRIHVQIVILAIAALLLLTACNSEFLQTSAQQSTGGNGAGLSEVQ